MPRLNVVAPEQAEGEVQELYAELQGKFGKVFNIFQGMGNSAAALKAYLSASGALSRGELSRQEREVVYLTVSERNGCEYCVAAHVGAAKKAKLDDGEIEAIRRLAPVSDQHKALATFVQSVMDAKGRVDDSDIEAVRKAGYSDGQIAESIAYIGLATYSNLFNHVFDTPLDFPPAPDLP